MVLFYHSGNRDESHFEEPWQLSVTRQPNHHLGFGGGGPHYCLGASLARTQLRSVFGELLRTLPDIRPASRRCSTPARSSTASSECRARSPPGLSAAAGTARYWIGMSSTGGGSARRRSRRSMYQSISARSASRTSFTASANLCMTSGGTSSRSERMAPISASSSPPGGRPEPSLPDACHPAAGGRVGS